MRNSKSGSQLESETPPSPKKRLFYHFEGVPPLDLTPKPDPESLLVDPPEKFIYQITVEDLNKNKKVTLVISDSSWYSYNEESKLNWKSSLFNLHSVNPDIRESKVVIVSHYSKDVNDPKKKGNELEIVDARYRCNSKLQRDEFAILFACVLDRFWQRALESTVIQEPEVYQTHMFLSKYTTRKKKQFDTCLVITKGRLYNCKLIGGSIDLKKSQLRFCVPIDALFSIRLYTKSPNAFALIFDKRSPSLKASKAKVHSRYVFECKDEPERQEYVAQIAHVYLMLTNRELMRECADGEAESSKS